MSDPVIIGNAKLYLGDCLDVLKMLPDNSVDAVVTDPPYMIGFMGKSFDHIDNNIAASVELWSQVRRVLKPGANLLAFGATRTHHRLYCAIEDAGLKIVDTICWMYGTGFPKNKALLKPAFEPICLAAKTGKRWLNIDVCRIECEPYVRVGSSDDIRGNNWQPGVKRNSIFLGDGVKRSHAAGRWPANLIHDGSDEVVALFPEQVSGEVHSHPIKGQRNIDFHKGLTHKIGNFKASKGSASRFFYCAKADKKDRESGCDKLRLAKRPTMGDGIGSQPNQQIENCRNNHPTVKPFTLMSYLCRLITPPNGIILDPFMGSGSTGKAAMHEGFRFIGIEKEPEYFDISCARITAAQQQTVLPLEVVA